MKDGLKLRHDEHKQKDHDQERHEHDDNWVDHRGLDLVSDLGGFFLEFRKARQNDFEHTAELSGLNHVDVKVVEDRRVLRERLRKSAATLHAVGKFVDRFLENFVALLFRENCQASQEGQPRVDQGRKLPCENHQELWLHFLRAGKG